MLFRSESNSNLVMHNDNFMSIDLGVFNIVSCYSNVVESFNIKNNTYSDLEYRIESIQSKRDLKKKKSNRWNKLNKVYKKYKAKLTNKRKDYQHKVSKKIIDICKYNSISKLIVGDIKVKKCKKEYKCKLNKSTQGIGLSRFKLFLEYKAKNINIDFIKVNESYTSQINCLTNVKEFNSDLSIRKVKLNNKIEIDRDLNSAINIAKKYKGKWLTQSDILLNILKGYKEMYVDYNSNLHMNRFYNNYSNL